MHKKNNKSEKSDKNDDLKKHAPKLLKSYEISAGGIVFKNIYKSRSEQQIALIGKLDRKSRMVWTFPKGHVEKGEKLPQTALREIKEETGITGRVINKLGMIKYVFNSESKKIHKDVHHFLVEYVSGELSDLDQEVSEVIWVDVVDAYDKLIFKDEIKLLRQAEKNIIHHKRVNKKLDNKVISNSEKSFFQRRNKKKK